MFGIGKKKDVVNPSRSVPGVPGSKRYFEYFVDQDSTGAWTWVARAYLPAGVTTAHGTATSNDAAREAAQTWGEQQLIGGVV